MRRGSMVAAMCAVVALAAYEGGAVNARYAYDLEMTGGGLPADLANAGLFIMATIRNDQVVKYDTLSKYLVRHTRFNFDDGTRIATLRSTKQLINGQVTDTEHKWFLSVFDLTTRTFSDLLQLPAMTESFQFGYGIVLAWPPGDWIYYQRMGTGAAGEIWRINSNNPSQNELVIDYIPAGSRQDALQHWQVAADMKIALVCTTPNMIQATHYFPPANNDPMSPESHLKSMGGCNPCLSVSGLFCGHFPNGGHEYIGFYEADLPNHTFNNITYLPYDGNGVGCAEFEIWTGVRDWSKELHFPLWSVNSDRWVTVNTAFPGFSAYESNNDITFCWMERTCINVSNLPRPGNVTYRAGYHPSMYVDDSPLGAYQDINGTWRDPATGRQVDAAIKPSLDILRVVTNAGGGNPAAQFVDFALGPDAPVGPQLLVSDDAAWLTCSVQGSRIENSINVAGLAGGYHRARVKVSATGTVPGTYTVVLKLDGPPVASTIVVNPEATMVLPGQTGLFTGHVLDQFGSPISSPITWSVSGGGTVSAEGVFTSDGSTGKFQVRASAGSASAAALADVNNGLPLPGGYLKSLLCLETMNEMEYLPVEEAPAVESLFTGANASTPAQGRVYAINGKDYVWRLRSDADGVWGDIGEFNNFCAYWHLTVMSPSSQQVRISSRHDDDVWVWNNGIQVGHLPGWGEGQTDAFTLNSGPNNLLFKLVDGRMGANNFSARIVNSSGADVAGLGFYPFEQRVGAARRDGAASTMLPLSLRAVGGSIRIGIVSPGTHTAALFDSRGRRVGAFAGTGAAEYSMHRKALSPGAYVVKIDAGGNVESRLVVVR